MSFPPDRQFIGKLRWTNVIQAQKWSSIGELKHRITDMIEREHISFMQVAVAGYEQIQRGFDGGQPYQVIAEITPSLDKGRFTFLPVEKPVEHQTIHDMWDTLEDRKARLRAADPSLNSFPSDSSTLSLTAADSYRSALDELDGKETEMLAFPEDLQLYYQSLVDLLGPSPPSYCLEDVDKDDRADSVADPAGSNSEPIWWFLADDEAEEEEESHEEHEANCSYTGSPEALRSEIAQKMKTVPASQPAIVHQLTAAKSEVAIIELWSPRSRPSRMADSESLKIVDFKSLTAADSYRSALDELDDEKAEKPAFPEDLHLLGPSPPRPCLEDDDEDANAESAAGTTDSSNDHLWRFWVDGEAEEEAEKAHEEHEVNSSYTGSPEALRSEIAQKMKMVPAFQPAVVHQIAAAKSEAAVAEMWLEPVVDKDDQDNSAFYVGSPAALFAEISQETKTLSVFEPVIVHQLTVASSESAVVELWSPRSRPSRVADAESSHVEPICVSDVPGYVHDDACMSPVSDDVELERPAYGNGKPAASITSDSADADAFPIEDCDYAGLGLAFLSANGSVSAASSLKSCSDCQSDSCGSASPCSDFSAASEVATPATSALGTSTPATEAEGKDAYQTPPITDVHDLVGLGLALGSARLDSLLSQGRPSSGTNPVNACGDRFPRTLDTDAGVCSSIKPPDVSQGFVRISGRQLPRTLDTDSQFGHSPDVMPSRTSSFVRLSGRRVQREMGSFGRYDLIGSPGASESKTGDGFKGRLKSKSLPNFFKKMISLSSRKPCA
ncbi:hypothetical protein FIBSPDRAFT_926451 [Athelia psychrophila]|uniref:Uncharacterized protein n=1 Tax=Athelia psychrophila TaxID=1759441 RepID=A0A166TIH7_9AGAM|nr:hypothetical protein FIBSPDRAFT_926451 [Fibularhizoctonia sp. CBS 109695]